ncbi:trace amine-associated receptor 5-like [Protopterus annectens]|uniref:trace amine-associated receptor 5-like n=1 Tax=Protopterus annectens TaxID=7888 RepID=UPI001CFAE657|nr:trace amine-associated receptor 5-like [Protopterus annectens]
MNSVFLQNDEELPFCYKSLNASCIKVMRSASAKVPAYFACVLGMLITIFGNLMVVVSVAHFKALHSPTNFLVLSLAVADFLLGVLVLPFSTVRLVETCWYFGDDFCRLHTCLDTIFCLVSIFHLCFVSFDHYCAICHPLLYPTKVTIPVVCAYIVVGWVVSVIYTSAWLYSDVLMITMGHLMTEDYCIGSCQLVFNKIWGWINFPVFFVPCFIMIGLYIKIYLVSRKQRRIIENVCESYQSRTDTKVSKRERKAAKTLGIAVGIYLFCWLPFMIDTLIDPFLNFSTPPLLFDILIWFAYFNSACNPIIYGFFYPWFRKSLKLTVTFKIFYSGSSLINLYQEK